MDFTQLVKLSTEDSLKIVILGLGLVMGGIAAQTSRRSSEIKELQDAIGTTSSELLERRVRKSHVRQSILRAKNFVLDTTLNSGTATATLDYFLKPDGWIQAIVERVQKGEITYRRIDAIYNKERLEYVVLMLLVYEGTESLFRY
ncbi:MAG: hypothetical protein M3Z04_10705, partial [Chloroflexota bacterium]|nr:hypothetical protein [Chloroflexota bacterium]